MSTKFLEILLMLIRFNKICMRSVFLGRPVSVTSVSIEGRPMEGSTPCRWLGVSGKSASTFIDTSVRGREFIIASTSRSKVCKASSSRFF